MLAGGEAADAFAPALLHLEAMDTTKQALALGAVHLLKLRPMYQIAWYSTCYATWRHSRGVRWLLNYPASKWV